jgi:hypothetical protein
VSWYGHHGQTIPQEHRTYIGFYGCYRADRVVCVGAPNGIKGTDMIRIRRWTWREECPACGEVHLFRPMWRAAYKQERRDRAEKQVHAKDAIREKIHDPHVGD